MHYCLSALFPCNYICSLKFNSKLAVIYDNNKNITVEYCQVITVGFMLCATANIPPPSIFQQYRARISSLSSVNPWLVSMYNTLYLYDDFYYVMVTNHRYLICLISSQLNTSIHPLGFPRSLGFLESLQGVPQEKVIKGVR